MLCVSAERPDFCTQKLGFCHSVSLFLSLSAKLAFCLCPSLTSGCGVQYPQVQLFHIYIRMIALLFGTTQHFYCISGIRYVECNSRRIIAAQLPSLGCVSHALYWWHNINRRLHENMQQFRILCFPCFSMYTKDACPLQNRQASQRGIWPPKAKVLRCRHRHAL